MEPLARKLLYVRRLQEDRIRRCLTTASPWLAKDVQALLEEHGGRSGFFYRFWRGWVEEQIEGLVANRGRAPAHSDYRCPVHPSRNLAFGFGVGAALTLERLEGDDLRVAAAWAGAEGGVWTREAKDELSRGFWRYLSETDSWVANWLQPLDEEDRSASLDVDLNDEMRALFSRYWGPTAGSR